MERIPFKERLKQGMELRGIKAVRLCELTGISKSRISQYLKGSFEAKQDSIYRIAKALDVSEAWLMGYDVPCERPLDKAGKALEGMSIYLQKDIETMNNIKELYGEDILTIVQYSLRLNDKGIRKLIEYCDLLEMKYSKSLPIENATIVKTVGLQSPPTQIVQTNKPPDELEEPETILISASDGKPAKAITKEIVEKIENAPSHTDDY